MLTLESTCAAARLYPEAMLVDKSPAITITMKYSLPQPIACSARSFLLFFRMLFLLSAAGAG